jgi:hypothetical protein
MVIIEQRLWGVWVFAASGLNLIDAAERASRLRAACGDTGVTGWRIRYEGDE